MVRRFMPVLSGGEANQRLCGAALSENQSGRGGFAQSNREECSQAMREINTSLRTWNAKPDLCRVGDGIGYVWAPRSFQPGELDPRHIALEGGPNAVIYRSSRQSPQIPAIPGR